jgi:hypothetical protein
MAKRVNGRKSQKAKSKNQKAKIIAREPERSENALLTLPIFFPLPIYPFALFVVSPFYFPGS